MLMIISTVSAIPFTAHAETSGDWEYSKIDDSSAKLTKYTGTDEELEIPDSIDGYTVTELGEFLFYKNTSIKYVTIPDTVVKVGDGAFSKCVEAEYFSIGENVEVISDSAFEYCQKVKSFCIPESVKYIGYYAFYDCTVLEKVYFGQKVDTIDEDAFNRCNNLNEVYCANDTMPANIKAGNDVFTTATKHFNHLHEEETLDAVEETCTDTGLTEGSACECGLIYERQELVPAKGHAWGNWITSSAADCNNDGIEVRVCSNDISHTETRIVPALGHDYDSVVTELTCTQDGFTTHTCSRCGDSYVDNVQKAQGHKYSKEYVVPEGANVINCVYTCENCGDTYTEELEQITGTYGNNISYTIDAKGVLTISGTGVIKDVGYSQPSPFKEFTFVKKVVISEGITKIGEYLFLDCDTIEEIALPESLTQISTGVFKGCKSLKSINIPAAVNTIISSFENCDSLERIDVSSDNSAYSSDDGILFNKDKTILYAYPSSKQNNEYAVPNSVTKVNSVAFWKNKYLEKVFIPSSVTEIGANVFNGCYNLKYVSIEATAATIERAMFNNCTSLKTVVLSDSVALIKYTAFSNCNILSDVYFVGTEEQWKKVTVEEYNEPLAAATMHYEHTHKGEAVQGYPATCTEAGLTDGSACECGMVFTEQAEIPALGHNYEAAVTEPTCTEDGYTTYTCANCGDSYNADETAALGHNYEAAVTEPTCTEGGYTTYTCTRCGGTYVDNEIAALGHNYEAAVTAPTCTEGGYTTYTCTVCSDTYKADEVAALGHDYTSVVIEPTCTEGGYTTYTCSRCGDSYVADEVAATGHTVVIDKAVEATCTTDGKTEGSHCAVCGEVFTEQTAVAALGHRYSKRIIAEPTCSTMGLIKYTCTICGDAYSEDTPMTAHTLVTDVAVVATCTQDGRTEGSHCSVCGEIITAQTMIPATGHTIVIIKAVAPTFKNAGKTQGQKCSVCGEIIVAQKTVAKLGSPKLSKVTAGKKQFKATWKSVKSIDGYQIQYSTSSKFKSGNKTATVKGGNTASKTVKSLKKNTKYFVRIRGYKTINGKKVYSSWSAKKTVTTK